MIRSHCLLLASSNGLSSVCVPLVFLCVQISSAYKDDSQITVEPTLMTSFYPNYPIKSLVSNILRYRELGLQHMNFGETQLSLLLWT